MQYQIDIASTKHNAIKYVIITWMAMISLFLLAASCTKEEPKHRDIVTATINGKPWKAGCEESPPFGCKIADLQYYSDTGSFSLRASNENKTVGVVIWLQDIFDIGSYKIKSGLTCGGFKIDNQPCGEWKLYIHENDMQEIEITKIDNQKKIIEGKFNYVGRDISECNNEPVLITDGIFRVKYRP